MSDVRKSPADQTIWRLLAIGINPDLTTPELYGLILEGETDIPLMSNGRILFFVDPMRAKAILDQYASSQVADVIDVDRPFFWCDVADALALVSTGGHDAAAIVLDTLNSLLDLVTATGIHMGDARKAALYSLANYCTMNRDLTKYFEDSGHSRRELIDAILWCVGAVVSKATIV